MKILFYLFFVFILLNTIGCSLISSNRIEKKDISQKINDISQNTEQSMITKEETQDLWKRIAIQSIKDIYPIYTFSVNIPEYWEIEAIPEIEAINFYDPELEGESNLDKSQLFVRYFRANSFLTLSTVTIYSETVSSTLGRPTVVYDIEKKEGVPDFPHQPFWRNERHTVTDIRETDSNPSTFYVIGKRPDLDEKVFEMFLYSIKFKDVSNNSLVEPIKDFKNRITKKPFGIYITPETSPIEEEKFIGFHTAVDVEYGDFLEDVPVYAIENGTVKISRWASGYGGVIAIHHVIEGKKYLGIYGHLDPQALTTNGKEVKKGEQIGVLGEGESYETDGARKHLHFGIYKKADINILGYVGTRQELLDWIDPQELF
jgi:murein DD-endopeptidase MepM/ murein hydrolase activator NlpD